MKDRIRTAVSAYVQSERQAQGIYLKYAEQLVQQGDAYYCFCGREELENMKRGCRQGDFHL